MEFERGDIVELLDRKDADMSTTAVVMSSDSDYSTLVLLSCMEAYANHGALLHITWRTSRIKMLIKRAGYFLDLQ